RLFMTGPGVYSSLKLSSREETHGYLRRYSEFYKTGTLKNYHLGGGRKVQQWIIMEAIQQGLRSTAEGIGDLKLNITRVLDGYSGWEHNIDVMPLYKDVVQLVAFSGTVNTPTYIVDYGGPPAEKYFFQNVLNRNDIKLRRFVPKGEIDAASL